MQFSVCLSTIIIISVSNCWDILWWPHSLFLTAKVCPIRRARLAKTITAAISILMSLFLADKDTSSYRSRQLWLLENSASSWNRCSRSNYCKTFCSALKVCSKQDYKLLSCELRLFCEGWTSGIILVGLLRGILYGTSPTPPQKWLLPNVTSISPQV